MSIQDPRLLELLTLYVGKMTLGGCREFATLSTTECELIRSIEGHDRLIHFEPVDNDAGLWKAYPLREWRDSEVRKAKFRETSKTDMQVYKARQAKLDKAKVLENTMIARQDHAVSRLREDHRELQKGLCETMIKDAAEGNTSVFSQDIRKKYLPWLLEVEL